MPRGFDFLLAGVGGQGTISAGDILADVGLRIGLDVKKSEVHGMSQRGGAVETHVRWGDRVFSPLIEQGRADFLLGFELLEAGRWLRYLAAHGTAVVNEGQIPPLAVAAGSRTYPEPGHLKEAIRRAAAGALFLDATGIAEKLGHPAIAGIVLLGAVSHMLEVDEGVWVAAIEQRVPARFREANLKGFAAGNRIAAGLAAG